MLGREIRDPEGIESSQPQIAGLGLLALDTVLEPEKRLANVRGYCALDHSPVSGYEIHAGRSTGQALERPALYIEGQAEGALSEDGQLMGTYLHGLFESPEGCQAILRWAGLDSAKSIDYAAIREQGIDRLADAVAQWLDVEQLRALIPELTTGQRIPA